MLLFERLESIQAARGAVNFDLGICMFIAGLLHGQYNLLVEDIRKPHANTSIRLQAIGSIRSDIDCYRQR